MIPPLLLEVAVIVLGAFLLMYEAFANDTKKDFVAYMGIAGLALVFVMSFFTGNSGNLPYAQFYQADRTAIFFKQFALVTTILVLIMSLEYQPMIRKFIFGANPQAGLGEFYSIPIFTCAGLMWMASAKDFIFIFISLELVTISFYVLVAYMRRNARSLEAGVKYLILGALSTGFLVYGITWIFGVSGETNLDRIAAKLQTLQHYDVPLLFGMMLVLVGLGFKIAAVPFQFWVPDVYQGAPTPVTAFLSVGSKAAGFIVLARVVEVFVSAPVLREKVIAVIVFIAAMTLIYGNLAALSQNNLKRLLAYSSIAHAGYLLVALASIGATHAGTAIIFYLAGYLLMTLLSFLILILVANHSDGDDIAHFNGLARRSPALAFSMLAAMASLAGIPFTVGFFGKFLVFEAAMEAAHTNHSIYALVGIGVITVAAGFYYYFKVIRAMYWQEPTNLSPITTSPLTRATILVLVALVFVFGIYPRPVIAMFAPKPAEQFAEAQPVR